MTVGRKRRMAAEPASGFELTLRVDAPPVAPDGETDFLGEESARVRTRVYAALRLRPRSVSWVTLRLGTPKAERAIEFLIEERRRGRAVVGAARLREIPGAAERAACEWSLLRTPQVDGSFSLWDDYPQCRAGTLPAESALNHSFVSERFVAFYRKARLNGLEFLRCRNSGRKPGPAWYVALPKHFLGRGLDHPWFDRARWAVQVAGDRNKRTTAVDIGQGAFHQFWLRQSQAEREPLLGQLLALCPMPARFGSGLYGLSFEMVARYFQGAQPDANFAYVPWGEDGPNRLGKMLRHRLLAVHRRAREALTEHGVFEDRDFLCVRSIAAPEPGVALLDTAAEVPGPMYTEGELAALRVREQELRRSDP